MCVHSCIPVVLFVESTRLVQDLMSESPKTPIGMNNLDGNNLPGYPLGIEEDIDAWPRNTATKKNLLRVDRQASRNPISSDGIQKVATRIRAVGP